MVGGGGEDEWEVPGPLAEQTPGVSYEQSESAEGEGGREETHSRGGLVQARVHESAQTYHESAVHAALHLEIHSTDNSPVCYSVLRINIYSSVCVI